MKVVNEGGNTLDLFTEEEGAMAFQQNDDYDSVVQRQEDEEEKDENQTLNSYVKNHEVDEDEIKTEDRSTFGEGWRGPKNQVEIGNFNLTHNNVNST